MQLNFVDTKEKARARMERIKEIKEATLNRPVAEMTDTELFAKVSGAPLTIAEDVLIAYEGNLYTVSGFVPEADAENRRYRHGTRAEDSRIIRVGQAARTVSRRETEDHSTRGRC